MPLWYNDVPVDLAVLVAARCRYSSVELFYYPLAVAFGGADRLCKGFSMLVRV